ncbi:MAG: hypothetical protein IPL32_07420 [Chloracidobacterium sp.]|nr:hypothetical protein [Chloracidobacterium sp.]
MELSKTQKILLGVLSAWPFVYIFLFFIFIFGLVALSPGGPGGGNDLDPFLGGGFVVLMVVHIITMFLIMALTVFYIVHAVKNTKLDSNMRIIWIVLFFFGGMIAEPIYWYLQIWKKPEPSIGQLNAQPASTWTADEDIRQGSYIPPNEPPDWR